MRKWRRKKTAESADSNEDDVKSMWYRHSPLNMVDTFQENATLSELMLS